MSSNQLQEYLGNILIVDDRPNNLRVLSEILSEKGYKVRKAINGKMALNATQSKQPDLILLDIMMPEMDGYEVCQHLKANPETKDIPIIFVSALNETLDKVKGFVLGGVDYITKPFQIEEVLARVENQLIIQRQKQQLIEQNTQLKQEILERQQVEQQLQLLHKAIDASYNGIMITDALQADNPIIYVNSGFEKLTGYSAEEVIGKNPRFLHKGEENQAALKEMSKALQEQRECNLIIKDTHKNGKVWWNQLSISPVFDTSGKLTHYLGVQTDITEHQEMETALRLSEEKFAEAFRASPDPMVICKWREGNLIDVNNSFCTLSGYTKEEAINQTTIDLRIWANLQDHYQITKMLTVIGRVSNQEINFRSKSGKIITILLSAEIIHIANEACVLVVGKDIRYRKRIEAEMAIANQELERLASIDCLTQIANRRKFERYLYQEWQRLKRERLPLAMIMCDVDYFKRYNDTYGHQAGDHCLKKVAQAISRATKRPADLVARYGGEEFAVILPNTKIEGAIHVAQLIQEEIERLEIIHLSSDVSKYITLSMGVASIVPTEKLSREILVAAADKGLYEAKKEGRAVIIKSDVI
ncbi:MAG: diguanylate cyclase [Microcoleaceae cyanobacterium]